MKRRLRTWPKVTIIVLLVGGGYYMVRSYERQAIYSPDAVIAATPAKTGLAFDNITVNAADGVNITGWFVPAESGGDAIVREQARPTLLYFHDGIGNMGDRLDKIRLFHEMGLNVFLIDYRGYGKSGGSPSERGLQLDALAAYFYLVDKRGVPPEELFLFGESLGAAVAIELLTKVQAAGLITEAAFVSTAETVEQAWPLIPWQFALRDKYESFKKIGNVRLPILLIHSTEDEVVPFDNARRLFAVAREPKELVEIHGTHRDGFLNSFDKYYDTISNFIQQHAPRETLAASTAPALPAPSLQDQEP